MSDYQDRLEQECDLARKAVLEIRARLQDDLDEILDRVDRTEEELKNGGPKTYESYYSDQGPSAGDMEDMLDDEIKWARLRLESNAAELALIDQASELVLPSPDRYTSAALWALEDAGPPTTDARPYLRFASTPAVVRVTLLAGAAQRWAASLPCEAYGKYGRQVDVEVGSGTDSPFWVTLTIRSIPPGDYLSDLDELLLPASLSKGKVRKVYAVPDELLNTREVSTVYCKAREGGHGRDAAVAATIGFLGPQVLSPAHPTKTRTRPPTSRRMNLQ